MIERFTPLAQSLAPSAAVAQVGGALRLFGVGPVGLAQRLRLQAAALYSLGTVVGIGSSWSVAAMASSCTGASGVLYVPASDTADFLGPLPVGELYGIRRTQATTLRALGVQTIGQLAVLPGATVARILGRPGRALRERAQGADHRMVVPGRAAETVSARADFAVDVLDGFEVRSAALRLAAELGARLRSREQAARSVTVVVRMADRTDLSKARTLVAPSAHTDDLRHAVYDILDGFGLQRARLRRLTLVAEAVDGGWAHTQLTLDGAREARLWVEAAIDRLNERYGPGTVGPAAALAG
ncbi:DinB/UmuC family translesion DNA polymerase [Streptomyces mirabilis]|uniref:DinB/UmuC family translesion DNA polymerase n=1 Tax=Streptomyces mirabilis TaxID=68239 RepID=UPI00341F2C8C